jgi:hypothetical protein
VIIKPIHPFCGATIAAKNYLSLARVLANSFSQHHPDIPFFVLLADEPDGYFQPKHEPFQVLRVADLNIHKVDHLRFRYTRQEFSYALTPYLIGHLLDQGFSAAIFLKQESLVLGDLQPEFSRLDRRSILLTPHLLAPLTGPEGVRRELDVLLSGTYNGGFLGVSGAPAARRFLAWWQDRLFDHCRHAVVDGMHFEQRWLDLAPVFFEGVEVLRDPGVNVGHWNLPERKIEVHGDQVTADDVPCRLFRFSGFDPDCPEAVTRYFSRLTLANVGPAAEVFRRYLSLLENAGYHRSKSWPYSYDHFDNHVPIPDIARLIYRGMGDSADRFGDPIKSQPPESYFRWLNTAWDSPADSSTTVTRLWREVYARRPDVQRAFPDIGGRDRESFLQWTAVHGAKEHHISEGFLAH